MIQAYQKAGAKKSLVRVGAHAAGRPVKGQKQKGSGSKKAVRAWWRGESLSAVFTQTRLFRPECVSAGILMLTYLSTLRSKSRRFLFRPKNAYFANSPNTSHRLRFAAASLRKATPRPAFDDERRKAEAQERREKQTAGKSLVRAAKAEDRDG